MQRFGHDELPECPDDEILLVVEPAVLHTRSRVRVLMQEER